MGRGGVSLTRKTVVVAGCFAAAIIAMVFSPGIGLQTITLHDLLSDEQARFIFTTLRLPRMVTAFFAGGCLAVCGLIYQAIFRNPLADPFTLGISSGASLGAALCILGGISGTVAGMSFITAGAFAGALAAMAVIYVFALSNESDSATILLAGVVVTTVCSGAIMFIHVIGGVHKSYQILRWLMGAVDGVAAQNAVMMIVPLLALLTVAVLFMPQLDLLSTGDTLAHSRGINIRNAKLLFISITTVMIATTVSVCGPIGFIGIIAPHACRMMLPGTRHRLLALCSFLTGGTFLIITDTIARSVAPPSEIPVGIITSLCGGPFFLIVLYRLKRRLLL